MKEIVVLTNFAKDMIKKDQYKKAKIALIKAVKLNPYSPPGFLLLGDTYFLLEDKLNAMKCYLAAVHLQINRFTKMQTATFSTMLKIKYEDAPEEIKDLLPCKEGMIIYEDSVIPSHIAHAYIDIDPSSPLDPIVRECSKIYKKHIATQTEIREVMKTSNICYEDYLEFEDSHYITLGRELLLDNIKWASITSKDVLRLYFSN